ncbi:CRISPR-associated helicase/endonuclease Cas3 [Clostridium merdae]|uniref:CRISPR-associated helicase/endonuclease Cas3 n=1 Tax=Clostridium merdae TaxID=1958780 RepID=UPI000A26CC53|nr:CRISPR-associated helicase/endonuclease Cas3 [Clostridium merdae]
METYLAHITEIDGVKVEQTIAEHSFHVANYAAENLKGMGLFYTAYLAGLLHDMGKCTAKYQQYLAKAAAGEDVVRGSVNHTFCGCIYLMQKYHVGKPQGMGTVTCELLVYAMGAHHGQFDCVTLQNTSGFEHRLEKDPNEIGYEEAVNAFLLECVSAEEIDRYFLLAQQEVTALFEQIRTRFNKKRTQVCFSMGLAARMLLSAVIDGDRRDTAEFMTGTRLDYRSGTSEFWAEQIAYFEDKLLQHDSQTPINMARSSFSDQCRGFATQQGGGIYRLTLPTGAGKTLSSLRYTLHHAKQFGKKRILFVIPLLSVLEQNSAVIRDYIKDKASLTEHHSNVVNVFDNLDELNQYQLLTETWDSPIVITTLVQFLNTLFSNKTTAVRRMGALLESVIVIDEVQSLPKRAMNLFTMALNFLVYDCGATVVLSSATTPCFDETDFPLLYTSPSEIVPHQKELFGVFKRTEIIDKTSPYGMAVEELADFSAEVFAQVNSLLLICNTKESAFKLYTELCNRLEDCTVFHLSTAMCMAHRTDTLKKINAALKNREKIVCVSTQLVEAGVDFSFESVIRVAAGIDNIAQAAGRCNRNNDFGGIRSVYIVNLKLDAEKLQMLQEIATAQRCSMQVLQQFKENPEHFEQDLLSEKSISEYYQFLFNDADIKGKFGFPQKLEDGSTENLFDLLAANERHTQRPEYKGKYFMNQAFLTAGSLFKVFDENTIDVIVPYNDEAKELIADLFSQKSAYSGAFLKRCIEKAKPYTIQIFHYQNEKLREYGMLSYTQDKRFTALNEQCYHSKIGLVIENFIF